MSAREKLDQAIVEYVRAENPEKPIISVNWVVGYEAVIHAPENPTEDGDLNDMLGYCGAHHLSTTGMIGITQAVAALALREGIQLDEA